MGDDHAAHGVERAAEKRQIGIAEISRILPEERGKQETLKKYVGLIGPEFNPIMLCQAARARFIFAVISIEFVPDGVNTGGREGTRGICVGEEGPELLLWRERLLIIQVGILFAHDGLIDLAFHELLDLCCGAGLGNRRRTWCLTLRRCCLRRVYRGSALAEGKAGKQQQQQWQGNSHTQSSKTRGTA